MSEPFSAPSRTGRAAAAATGAAAVLAGLAVIWWARLQQSGSGIYVSQLGAASMPDAVLFNAAMLVLAVGGVLVGWSVRGLRSPVRVLGAWTVSASLVVSGSAFAVASRVTCTDGCPIPFTATAAAQDAVHIAAAVVGFAAATWAMVQAGWVPVPRPVRRVSRVGAVAVGISALTGALLSLWSGDTGVGATLEFVAMTVAVVWLATFGLHRAVGRGAAASGPSAPAVAGSGSPSGGVRPAVMTAPRPLRPTTSR